MKKIIMIMMTTIITLIVVMKIKIIYITIIVVVVTKITITKVNNNIINNININNKKKIIIIILVNVKFDKKCCSHQGFSDVLNYPQISLTSFKKNGHKSPSCKHVDLLKLAQRCCLSHKRPYKRNSF